MSFGPERQDEPKRQERINRMRRVLQSSIREGLVPITEHTKVKEYGVVVFIEERYGERAKADAYFLLTDGIEPEEPPQDRAYFGTEPYLALSLPEEDRADINLSDLSAAVVRGKQLFSMDELRRLAEKHPNIPTTELMELLSKEISPTFDRFGISQSRLERDAEDCIVYGVRDQGLVDRVKKAIADVPAIPVIDSVVAVSSPFGGY